MPESRPTFRQALAFWVKLGWISFGGPAGQISIMHRELVEQRRWVSEQAFLRALQYCMLLPGPEAQQLATYLGWRLHGVRGGIVAGSLFVLPSALLLFGISWLYVCYREARWLEGLFTGFQAAVIVIIVSALIRMSGKTLTRWPERLMALGALGLMIWGAVSFIWIIALAGICGLVFSEPPKTEEEAEHDSVRSGNSLRKSLVTTAICLLLWFVPLLGLFISVGPESTLFQLGTFFSKAAVVTFGGAYAVLPYVSQMAVEHYQWIEHPQMMDGLALAETTPGPLIMVLQFVGFLSAWNHPGQMEPWLASLLGAAITLWVTFVPCFLFILVGAPHVDSLGRFPRWQRAMQGISAAVVGLIAHLAFQFGTNALAPAGDGFQWATAALVLVAWLAMRLGNGSMMTALTACGILGILTTWALP